MGTAKVKRKLDPGIAAIIAAVIGAIALVGGGFLGRATAPIKSPSPAPTVTRTVTPAPQPVHLGFSLTSTAVVPWCNTFNGIGSIPEGDSLLIFDSPLGPNGQPLAQTRYFFDGIAAQTSRDAWSVSSVYIGDKNETGLYAAIDGVLVTNQTASFIKSVVAEPVNPANAMVAWKSKALPPGVAHIHLAVVRNANTGQCAS
jgi:hypothetical protein